MSSSLQPYGIQHTRPRCPSPAPGVYSNSYPLSQWCHPTLSSSVFPFSSCLLSFPTSGSFQMSQLFASGGQSIGVSASTSVLQMNIQDWFPLQWMVGSPCSPRAPQESSPTPQFKSINSSVLSFLYNIQPWGTPFPIWNQSVVPCPVLTVASWPAYRSLKRQVRWSGIPISFRIFYRYCDPHSQRFWHSQ